MTEQTLEQEILLGMGGTLCDDKEVKSQEFIKT